MGINAVCYLKLTSPITLEVMQSTLSTIKEVANELIRDYVAAHEGEHIPIPYRTTGGFSSYTPNLSYMSFTFSLGKEERRDMSIHFGCHHDSDEFFLGENVILSLGVWGSVDKIMEAMAKRLIEHDFFEVAYYVPNDSDRERTFRRFKEEATSESPA